MQPTDILLPDGAGWNNQRSASPTINLANGQFGSMADYERFLDATPYVGEHVIPVLLEPPVGFQYLKDSNLWYQALKALIEIKAKSIEGLNSGIEVAYADTPFGGAGEQMSKATNVTRQVSALSYTWDEVAWKGIANYWGSYIRLLIGDEENKTPLITAINPAVKASDFLINFCSFSVMYIEPDASGTRVVDAWLMRGMQPESEGDRTGKRDLNSEKETKEVNISFKGLQQVGWGVIQQAQTILTARNYRGANPNLRSTYIDDIDANVKAALTGNADLIDRINRTAVR